MDSLAAQPVLERLKKDQQVVEKAEELVETAAE
jgi:hypothetical protein